VVSLVLAPSASAQQADERFVVIKARKIITITGKEIEDGVLILSGGKVRSVGRGIEYPGNSKIIDASDRVVMPGLINVHTRFGLPSYRRSGVRGHLTVEKEFFPREGRFDELLDAGYTAVALVPAGSGIPGRAMVVRTAGDPEQRKLAAVSYLKVSADKRTFRGALERAKKEIEKVEKARKAFEEKQKKEAQKKAAQKKAPKKKPPATKPTTKPTTAPATQPAFKPPKIDPAHQVLVDLIQKKEGVFALIEVRRASDYLHMADVLKQYDVAHRFYGRIAQQSDLYRVAEQLGDKKTPIALPARLNRIPVSAERLHVVRELAAAGCEISLVPVSDSAREHRNVLVRLAELVREGWEREAALKSVTLHPARMLDLEKRFGSIEKGKEADLIFLDGDPLDPTTRVREVMIAGEIVHRVEGDLP
jgi:hypothetical protein